MVALNKNFKKWIIIISVIIILIIVIRIFIWLLPFTLLLLAGLWIYSKLSKFSFGKRKVNQTKTEETNYTEDNNIPNSEKYQDAVEIDKEKVIDVEFVEEKKNN
jgi:FtsZ-interacting cell division protein ZipA